MNSTIRRAFEYVELLYSSVTDETNWSAFLAKVSSEFKDASVALWHSDNRAPEFNLSEYVRYDPDAMQSMKEHYYAVNPWVPKKLLKPGGVLHRTEDLYPERELLKTEFYNDFLRPNDLFKGFGISLRRDNQGESPATIRMTAPFWPYEGRTKS